MKLEKLGPVGPEVFWSVVAKVVLNERSREIGPLLEKRRPNGHVAREVQEPAVVTVVACKSLQHR